MAILRREVRIMLVGDTMKSISHKVVFRQRRPFRHDDDAELPTRNPLGRNRNIAIRNPGFPIRSISTATARSHPHPGRGTAKGIARKPPQGAEGISTEIGWTTHGIFWNSVEIQSIKKR
jgi:hypothetical protein